MIQSIHTAEELAIQTLSMEIEDWERLQSELGCRPVRELPERRCHDRYNFDDIIQIVLHLAEQGQPRRYLVRSRNISKGGMAFLHHRPIPERTLCTTTLFKPFHTEILVAGRIAHCEQLRNDVYNVGMSFEHAIDLAAFMAA